MQQSHHPASSIKPFQTINIFERIYKFRDLFRAKVRYQNIVPVEIPCLVQLQGNQDRRDLSRVFLDSPNWFQPINPEKKQNTLKWSSKWHQKPQQLGCGGTMLILIVFPHFCRRILPFLQKREFTSRRLKVQKSCKFQEFWERNYHKTSEELCESI